jgi:HEAT repeat protein
MAIKPIEKANHPTMLMKIGVLVFLIGVGYLLSKVSVNKKNIATRAEVLSVESERIVKENTQNLAVSLMDKSKDVIGDVLGEATDLVEEVASRSADTVSDFIFDKATDPLIDQIKKLPPNQQEEIKKNICR